MYIVKCCLLKKSIYKKDNKIIQVSMRILLFMVCAVIGVFVPKTDLCNVKAGMSTDFGVTISLEEIEALTLVIQMTCLCKGLQFLLWICSMGIKWFKRKVVKSNKTSMWSVIQNSILLYTSWNNISFFTTNNLK